MLKPSIATIVIVAAAYIAAADPPRNEIVEANHLLQQGNTNEALQAYRNLQIDDPESELLYYNIGCAQYESAPEPNADAPDDSIAAINTLNAAKASFNKAAMADSPDIRRDARYNRVNCDSLLTTHLAATGDHETAVKMFEDTIFGYEDFLEQYPGHPGAQKNLNKARYELKKMLQDPPEPQEEQDQDQGEDGEGEENQDGDQEQEGDQQEGESKDEPGDQNSQEQSDQQQPGDESNPEEGTDKEKQDQSGEDQSGEGESGPDSAEGDEEKSGDSQAKADGTPGEESKELPNKETIESILDALQERDKEEQQNMRRVPQNPRRSGPWW